MLVAEINTNDTLLEVSIDDSIKSKTLEERLSIPNMYARKVTRVS